MANQDALYEHLRTGMTTVARCWSLKRRDGLVLGFTDHDLSLSFEGIEFLASSGLSARTLQQGTGLSVDNTEAIGALSHVSIREEDIVSGRFDSAEVTAWLVNWQDVTERVVQFKGSLGEIQRIDGQFTAELRGLTEGLNQPRGRVYQKPCTAVLGDAACKVDLSDPGYATDAIVARVTDARTLDVGALSSFAQGWFTRGTLSALDGEAQGLLAVIKEDRGQGNERRLTLWSDLRAGLEVGSRVRVVAGCDKRFETCKLKFDNTLNFRGFPDIPGEDWLISYPSRTGQNDGGAL